MFCFKCGKEIKDNIKFCPYCGQKQINKSNNIPTDNKITVNKPQVTEKKNGLIFAVIGVCAFIMVAFLVVGIYLVKLSDLKKEARFRTFKDAFLWLNEAMIVNNCYNVTNPAMGLALSAEESTLKCYMGDTGLLVTLAFMDMPASRGGTGFPSRGYGSGSSWT